MNEERGKKAFQFYEAVKDNEKKRRLLLAENAALLSEIFDNKYYKELLGDEEGEWAGLLSDIEIYYSRNQVNTYIRVYKKLTKELGVLPVEWISLPISRLIDCLPFIATNNWQEWFRKASVLISKDWQIEIRKSAGKITEDDIHEHNFVDYEICKICGLRHKK